MGQVDCKRNVREVVCSNADTRDIDSLKKREIAALNSTLRVHRGRQSLRPGARRAAATLGVHSSSFALAGQQLSRSSLAIHS